MTLGELLQQFAGQGESDPNAAAYLRNPQSRPEITNRGRYRLQEPLRGRGHIEDRRVPQFTPDPNRPPVFPYAQRPQLMRAQIPRSVMEASPTFADYANNTMNLETRPLSGVPMGGPMSAPEMMASPSQAVPATAMPQPQGDPNLAALLEAFAQPMAESRQQHLAMARRGQVGLFGRRQPQ